MSALLRQTIAVTAANLRSVPSRAGPALVVGIGVASVVAVLSTALAMATGFRSIVANAGRADRAIVLGNGAASDVLSSVSREGVAEIEAAPGIARLVAGGAGVSPETVLPVNLPRAGGDRTSPVTVRGVTASAFEVRPEIRVVSGRMFRGGVNEIVVGRAARERFAHLDVGDIARFHNADWNVVGVFESGGDIHEAELMADAATLMAAADRPAFSVVVVQLDSPSSLDLLRAALARSPVLTAEVRRESDYYAEQKKDLAALGDIAATIVAGIMAIGALFGALNTMYSAVSARAAEIATLRAIGFGATPVVLSVLIEALMLALVGGAAGGAIAWLLFNGASFGTGDIYGQIAGRLHVGVPLIAEGLAWAAAIGLLGGSFPAIHAARLSVAEALRRA